MSAPESHSCGQHRQRAALVDLEGHLRRRSRRVTGPRQAILRVLRDQARPLTAREILAGLAQDECDLATIYRSLHMLGGMGLVCRLHFGDGVCRFELADNPAEGGHHHHHLICTRCSGVVELDICDVERLERQVEQANGYKSVTHRLEFFGVCPGCQ